MIVNSEGGVTLIGGAPVQRSVLKQCLSVAPVLVAADGGAKQALSLGAAPTATLGDLDSLDKRTRAALPAASIHAITEQDTTDFAKTLRHISAPFILATGVTGGWVDHTLAALSTLAAHKGPPCVIVGEEEVIFAAPREITLELPLGTRLSLFPMAPIQGRSDGLTWPIDGLTLGPAAQLGTSNRSCAPRVRLWFEVSGALVLLPRAALGAVLEGLGISACSPGSSGL